MNLSGIGFIPNSTNFVDEGLPPCAEADPEAFFPQEREFDGKLISSNYHDESGAKEVCNTCPYKQRCLQFALDYSSPIIGIWGGTTEGERKLMRRRIARARNKTAKTEVK